MMPEPSKVFYDAFNARLTALERDNADMQRALDALDKDWRTKIAPAPTGASGSMTTHEEPAIIGYVTPKGGSANVREYASTRDHSTIISRLNSTATAMNAADVIDRRSDEFDVFNYETGRTFVWYKLRSGGYVREDVVNFRPTNGTHSDTPITPINAALWPMPCQGSITNTHHNERDHDGIDIAAPLGTLIYAGPNGGTVVKAFECRHCKQNGDGIASLNDASKGYGYGSHVVVRYEYAHLPQRVQAIIPRGAFLHSMYAHLDDVLVSEGDVLQPYDMIGVVGATGNTYGVNPWHLHWALHWSLEPNADFYSIRANAIDPMLLIKA
jgi:hypothetical protein